MKVKIAAH